MLFLLKEFFCALSTDPSRSFVEVFPRRPFQPFNCTVCIGAGLSPTMYNLERSTREPSSKLILDNLSDGGVSVVYICFLRS